jgi:hypothetical protein
MLLSADLQSKQPPDHRDGLLRRHRCCDTVSELLDFKGQTVHPNPNPYLESTSAPPFVCIALVAAVYTTKAV